MKKAILSLLLCLIAVAAQADRLTLSQARQLATPYMPNGTAPQAVAHRIAARSTAQPQDLQPIYVFSRGKGKGFVLVSGHDALPGVLGYAEQGDFDENDMSPALRDLLEYYAAAAEQAEAQELPAATRRKAAGTKDIAPLMQTHWHQSWPYNNQCPFITGTNNRALTGCVATAASQIIYYWHKDLGNRTKYNTPTYGYGDAPVTESIPSGTPLKWDLMQKSYSGSEPEECTSAVATLMACVGASNWLTYGSSTAGQINDSRQVFSSQFGLNGGETVWRGNYSQATWEKMIVQELELGRPILYSGVHPDNGGHAVVIDGYKASNNLFHFNFGWGGQGDGYYTVDGTTGMNGFNDGQGMVYHIYPKTPNLAGEIYCTGNQVLSRVPNSVTVKVTNHGTLPHQGILLYCLTGNGNPTSSSAVQDKDTETIIAPGETQTFHFTFSPTAISTYTLHLTDGNRNSIAKLGGLESVATQPALTLLGLSVDDGGTQETVQDGSDSHPVHHIYTTKKTCVTARFSNGASGTLCAPTVQGNLSKLDGTGFVQQSSRTKKDVTFEPGGTGEMVFDLSSLTNDIVYKFTLAGTARTDKAYPIDYATPDTAIYFKLVGSNLALETSEDGTEARLTGNYNPDVFATLCKDEAVARYVMTGVCGLKAPLAAANPNALFYTTAEQGMSGRNIVADGVCDQLDLTPGHNFLPREDFRALTATYHATQADGQFGTAVLPFTAATPSGLMARRVQLVKGSYLQEVDSCNLVMHGGTPYIILSGTAVDITAKSVDVSTRTASLGTDTLRGTWTNLTATETQYMLDNASTQYFNTCTGQTIPALTAYLEYNKKVRGLSYEYATKDRKALQLAQQIAQAAATLEEYAYAATQRSHALLSAAIREAGDSLRTQPEAAFQTEQIHKLQAAEESYIQQCANVLPNGMEDKTYCILNPSFELGSTKNWTVTAASVAKTSSGLANYMSGADGVCVLNLRQGGSATQTLTGLPNGLYQLTASVAADYGKHIALTAGVERVEAEASDFGPMYFTEATVEGVRVDDGILTIGVESVDGTAKADNFRLYLVQADDTPVCAPQATAAGTTRNGIYDLMGRRLQQVPAKGIYIRDGKKYVR